MTTIIPFIGVFGFFVLYLIFGMFNGLLCNVIGLLYPAYKSIKAIETPNKEDDTKWLTYWVVFAAFVILDHFSGFILQYFPFYWLLKCIFVVWCYFPSEKYNGSMMIYERIIKPYYLKNHEEIEIIARKVGLNLKENKQRKEE